MTYVNECEWALDVYCIPSLDLHTSGGDGVVTTGGFLQLPSVNFPTPLSMLPKKV